MSAPHPGSGLCWSRRAISRSLPSDELIADERGDEVDGRLPIVPGGGVLEDIGRLRGRSAERVIEFERFMSGSSRATMRSR